MQFFYQTLTGRWPFLILGLLLISMWGTLLLSGPSAVLTADQENKATYGLSLPNVMAPVIRKEVNKEPPEEEDNFAGRSIRLPNLLNLVNGWK